MTIIYCISGFPSMCYMTRGVSATINLFTVACCCFVSTQRCRSGAKHWAFQKEKRRKQNIMIFAFVSLNVYANVFIVFKTVGERCLCHISFFSFLNLNLHRCSVESSLVPKTTSSPCELWCIVSKTNKTDCCQNATL